MTTEIAPDTVYLVVGTRSKVHRAVRVGSLLLTAEGDNLDQTDDREEISAEEAREIVNREPERRCRRCFWR